MPELPDVEAFRRTARKALRKRIGSVNTHRSRIFRVSDKTLKRHLGGRRLTGTRRRGKHLLLRISDGRFLALHFGMTGSVSYSEDEPEHTALALRLTNGRTLSIVSVRKLGKIDVVGSVGGYIKEQGLGPDALSIGRDDFVRLMGESKGAIKTALMDQRKIAGIGNIYADEILYQTGMMPDSGLGELGESDFKRVHAAMKRILKTAIKHGANPEEFPDRYLDRRREEGAECGICGGIIRKTTVNGRPTYYCPKHQR